MTTTVAVVIVTFLVCQLPYYCMDVYNYHKRALVVEYLEAGERYPVPGRREMIRHVYLYTFSQILLFISSCINPILYGIFNENFSKYVRNYIFSIYDNVAL